MTDIDFELDVDWAADSFPTDESGRMVAFTIRRGQTSDVWGNSAYTYVNPGEFDIQLDNYDRRYDPYYAAGPLYGDIKPHRKMHFRAFYPSYDEGQYDLITGWVRDVRQIEDQLHQFAYLSGKDGMDWLLAQKCPDLALQSDYLVSDAVAALVNGVSWPYGVSSEDISDTLPYWWSDHGQSVMEELRGISGAFAGHAFVAAGGTFTYKSRLFEGDAVVTIDGDIIGDKLERPQPWSELYNVLRVTALPRQATAGNTELFRLNDTPSILAGETLTLWCEYNYLGQPCPASSITTPVASTDYTIGSTPAGTDKTGQVTLVMTDYATRAKIEITNNDAGTVYVSLLKLRGTGIYNYSKAAAEAEDTASSDPDTGYGPRGLSLSSEWMQELEEATNHANYATLMFANPRKILWVVIEDFPAYQLAADLFDKVAVSITDLDIDGTYVLTYIEHTWTMDDNILRTKWRLTPAPEDVTTFWILGVSELGTSTVLAW